MATSLAGGPRRADGTNIRTLAEQVRDVDKERRAAREGLKKTKVGTPEHAEKTVELGLLEAVHELSGDIRKIAGTDDDMLALTRCTQLLDLWMDKDYSFEARFQEPFNKLAGVLLVATKTFHKEERAKTERFIREKRAKREADERQLMSCVSGLAKELRERVSK